MRLFFVLLKQSNGTTSYFASGWDYEKVGNWHTVGHDGGAVVRTRLLYRDDLQAHMIIIYLTNGNLDGVFSRTLANSIQMNVLPDRFSRLKAWVNHYL